MTTLPAIFVAHGAPTLALDRQRGEALRHWGSLLPKPTAVLAFSAHWQTRQLSLGETCRHDELIYDFEGFPAALYAVQYPAPGAPDLAARISKLPDLPDGLPVQQRGLDHGVWVPLCHLWPTADVPILQMTLPYPWTDKQLFELGQCLAPLRREGVMILGTGVLTHNLAELDMAEQQPVPDWARDFDQWVADTLDRGELDALIHWQERAPEARRNHPDPEHFRPLLVVAGAAWGDKVSYPVTGFEYGSLSRRCVQFGVTR